MSEIHIKTEQLQVVPGLLGGFIFFLGLCSLIVKERLYLSETLLAMVFGILIGPYVLDWVDPSEWISNKDVLSQEFSRYALAIEVMIAGVTLPKKYLMREWKSVAMLLLPIMTTMWLVSSAILKFTFKIPFLHALAIGACIAPTDPVLANAILKGVFAEQHVPLRLRNILTAESGANDGLGYPFLFFALYLMRLPSGKAIGTWFYATWVYQILLSAVIGAVAGYIARKALRYAETAGWVDKESFLSSSITLALLLVGVCTIIGTDDIFCCFIAGNSFTWDDWFRIESEDTGLQETLNGLISMSFFIYFGTIIPWSAYTSENVLDPWRIVVVIVLVMCLRRLPMIMLSYRLIPAIRTWQEALFAGWFGPIGVSALFYSIETIKQLEENENSNGGRIGEIVYPIICAIVFGSVLVHGVTIPLVLMGKRVKTTLSVSASSVWNQPGRMMSFRNLSARRRGRNNDDSDSQANIPGIGVISTIDKGGLPPYISSPPGPDDAKQGCEFKTQQTVGADTEESKIESRPDDGFSPTTEVTFNNSTTTDRDGLYTVGRSGGGSFPSAPEQAAVANERGDIT
ncbi:Na+/H+ antiporter [Coemansia sp. Benny D160-2]|nr:Na+/H+ antiporter [Coemansia sp. Benny D160-2]